MISLLENCKTTLIRVKFPVLTHSRINSNTSVMDPYIEVEEFIRNLDLFSSIQREAILMLVMAVSHVVEVP